MQEEQNCTKKSTVSVDCVLADSGEFERFMVTKLPIGAKIFELEKDEEIRYLGLGEG